MSYIFVDVEEARRCAGLLSEETARLHSILQAAPAPVVPGLQALYDHVASLTADLITETEKYSTADEKMKSLHLLTNERTENANGKG